MEKFTLTLEEAKLLDRIADATKMDCWFQIDEQLHVHDIEENMPNATDAELVCMLEDGLGYGLTEPQSGGLTEDEAAKAQACFDRARASVSGGGERTEPMTGTEVMDIICSLARSQGFYGRLWLDMDELRREDPEAYRDTLEEWEKEKFTDVLQVVRYFEEGKHNVKTSYWTVPVVYEMYGSISVEASSAEEAYKLVRDHPEDYDLPDEGFYVDDSFHVSDDDEENAVAMIKELSGNDGYEGPADDAASGRHTGLTVKATVTFQKWEGDIARFNGEAEFDACDALDSMDDEKIAQIERGEPYALDAVYKIAVRLGQIHDYDGPFEVELDEDNLSDYLEARRNG